jgi:hypothetical protein
MFFLYINNPNMYQPDAISQPGAVDSKQCLPDFSAADDGVWQLPATSGLVNVTALDASVNTLDACLAACQQTGPVTTLDSCQFISYDYRTGTCWLRQATPGSSR